MARTTGTNPIRSETGKAVVALALAAFATVEVIYEWTAAWRGLKRAMTGWWDSLERREEEGAWRDAGQWLASMRQRHAASSGAGGQSPGLLRERAGATG
jgi:hypothetical protein